MNKSLFLAFVFLGAAARLGAQDFKPIAFEEYSLANGLRVILHEDHSAPVVATYMLYKVGSSNEVADRTGFAHFFEHLMFEGSEYIGRGEIDKLISSAGGENNASTNFDQTDYYFKVPGNQLQLALWIESERMLHLKIDSLGVETQRKVVKEEKKQNMENRPYGTIFENLFKQSFAGTPYEWTPIGSAQYIDQATIDEFRRFHDRFYLPSNACLVVSGDLDPVQAKKWIADYFTAIPAGSRPEPPVVSLPAQGAERRMEVKEEKTPLPGLIISYPTPGRHNPDAYALDFLGKILAAGRSSRLYQRLVDKDQLAIQAISFPFMLDQGGLFAFLAIANQGVGIPAMEKAIDEEIARIQDEGVTEEEFQKTRNQEEAEFVSSFGSVLDIARKLALFNLFFNDTKLVNTELEKYMAVKREDIRRVAQTYLVPAHKNVLEYAVVKK